MEVRIAQTARELSEIHQMLIEVNLMELHKSYIQWEVKNDPGTIWLAAIHENKTVGCVRLRYGCDAQYLKEYWGLSTAMILKNIAICDRLVVSAAHRHSRAAYLLTTNIYQVALKNKTELTFMEAEEHLLPFYRKLGFEVYRKVNHSYGTRFQLFINPNDGLRLDLLRSPFSSHYYQLRNQTTV